MPSPNTPRSIKPLSQAIRDLKSIQEIEANWRGQGDVVMRRSRQGLGLEPRTVQVKAMLTPTFYDEVYAPIAKILQLSIGTLAVRLIEYGIGRLLDDRTHRATYHLLADLTVDPTIIPDHIRRIAQAHRKRAKIAEMQAKNTKKGGIPTSQQG